MAGILLFVALILVLMARTFKKDEIRSFGGGLNLDRRAYYLVAAFVCFCALILAIAGFLEG
jgi:hypothetical protein